MVTSPLRRICWPQTYRIIRSIFPAIDLFEDIADPADWEAVASAEAKANPRVNLAVGDLSLVPLDRRVGGPGASWVMAPFVHASKLRPSRFSDGSYGAYYAGDSEEVALAETMHHHGRTMAATDQEPGWTSDFRLLAGSIDRALHDVGEMPDALDPDDHAIAQAVGRRLRLAGSDGLTYPSVRQPGGGCIGVFYPDVVTIPAQAGHYSYHWNGERVNYVKRLDGPEAGTVYAVD
ncbi:MAG: RES family NAD+ phosphorylase [Pseudomonadota bacterium]